MTPLPDPVTPAVTPTVTPTISLDDAREDIKYDGRSYEEVEDTLRSTKKQNSTLVISNLRMQPASKFRLHIPLCRLISMPLIRPTMRSDVKRLEAEFVHGYRDGDRVFYVSLASDTGEEKVVSASDEDGWGPHWQQEHEDFESKLKGDPTLDVLSGHMFFVWDGNHRLLAWRNFIDRVHAEDRDWHLSVECIVLNATDSTPIFLNALHDINMQAVAPFSPRHRPFYADPEFLRSPMKPFRLPCYIKAVALAEAEILLRVTETAVSMTQMF